MPVGLNGQPLARRRKFPIILPERNRTTDRGPLRPFVPNDLDPRVPTPPSSGERTDRDRNDGERAETTEDHDGEVQIEDTHGYCLRLKTSGMATHGGPNGRIFESGIP